MWKSANRNFRADIVHTVDIFYGSSHDPAGGRGYILCGDLLARDIGDAAIIDIQFVISFVDPDQIWVADGRKAQRGLGLMTAACLGISRRNALSDVPSLRLRPN